MRFLLCLCMLFLATGCSTYSLQELRTTPPKGTPFQAALAVRYMKFSEEKAAKYNWADSGYFADKGLNAAYGHDVPPEDVSRWNLSEDKYPVLEAVHAELVKVLESGAKESEPDAAAAAQVFFDCWVENQSNNWQPDAIAYCRDGFEQAMQKLAAGTGTAAGGAATEGAPAAEEAPKKEAYIVFFGMNRDSLDDNGEQLVDAVADEIKKQNSQGYTVVLNGHTDTVGGKRYNFDLSRRRAQTVLQALAERGIPKTKISAFGFGDTDLTVPTGPGVPEPRNRRVEIYIGDQ